MAARQTQMEMVNSTLRIQFIGRKDKRGDDYYFTTTKIPISLDLSDSCIHMFPWEEDENEFGLTMVFRKYEPNQTRQQAGEHQASRRRYTQRKPDDVSGEVDDPNENEDEE